MASSLSNASRRGSDRSSSSSSDDVNDYDFLPKKFEIDEDDDATSPRSSSPATHRDWNKRRSIFVKSDKGESIINYDKF